MNILLTGATSFTGMWFARTLAAEGARIVAPLLGDVGSYSGVRASRVRVLEKIAEIVPECAFGGDRFLDIASARDFDVLCHHAARVTGYRDPDFDVVGAVEGNTRHFRDVLTRMKSRGLRAVVATGSVFEPDEGAGDAPLCAFSAYGLSKGLSWQIFRHWCGALGVPLGKFVIANPFGPFEEPRFGAYLVGTWRKGETATVRTPRYLRDNIHVDLLALAYADFVKQICATPMDRKFGPCGYIETQGAFAERVARELAPRLGFPCRVESLEQTDFSEPLARVNTHAIDPAAYGWSETRAWDAMAEYYLEART